VANSKRRVLAVCCAAALCGAQLWADTKYTDPDAPTTERVAMEALSRMHIVEIVGLSNSLDSVIKDLGAKVTAVEIQVDIPSDVLFDFDRSDIRPAAATTLKKLAQLIQAHAGAPVRIEGHTDNLGADAYNFRLSDRRAGSVKTWLVQYEGVEASRLATAGLGKTRPIAPNTRPDGSDDPEGRQRNRRVHIAIRTK